MTFYSYTCQTGLRGNVPYTFYPPNSRFGSAPVSWMKRPCWKLSSTLNITGHRFS